MGQKVFWKKVTKLDWDDENYSKYFVRQKLLSKKKFSNTAILKHT